MSVFDRPASATRDLYAHYGLSKTAARAGIRQFQQALQGAAKGLPGAAERAAHLEQNAAKLVGGRQYAGVGRLGAGMEGVADHILTPNHGAQALKIHDPTSPLYSPNIIAGKQQFVGKEIPDLATLRQQIPMKGSLGGREVPAFTGDIVKGTAFEQATPQQRRAISQAQERLKSLEVGGHGVFDAHAGNFKVGPDGKAVAYDYMPVPSHELLPASQRGHMNMPAENFKNPWSNSLIDSQNHSNPNAPASLRESLMPASVRESIDQHLQSADPRLRNWAKAQQDRFERHYGGQVMAGAHKPNYLPTQFQAQPLPRTAVRSPIPQTLPQRQQVPVSGVTSDPNAVTAPAPGYAHTNPAQTRVDKPGAVKRTRTVPVEDPDFF